MDSSLKLQAQLALLGAGVLALAVVFCPSDRVPGDGSSHPGAERLAISASTVQDGHGEAMSGHRLKLESLLAKAYSASAKTLIDEVRGWAGEDPAGLLKWSRSIEDDTSRDAVLEELGYVLAETDGAAAAALAGEMTEPSNRASYVRRVAFHWSSRELLPAVEWVQGMSAGRLRDEAVMSVVLSWAEQDAPGAATFVAAQIPPGEAQERAAQHVALRWSHHEPLEALAWVAEFSDPSIRNQISNTVLEHWNHRDPAAARSYTARFPPPKHVSPSGI